MLRLPRKLQESPAKAIGRPRRLSLRAVVDAAAEVGLENLSMGAVAARLGVGVTTIYTYVRSRDELLQLVALRLAWRPLMEDTGQHWSEIMRAQADGIFALFSTDPELLNQMISGALDPEDEMEEVEAFLKLLVARGFAVEAAFSHYRTLTQLAFGAAVGAAMVAKWRAQGERRRTKVARSLAERDPDELPLLRSLGAAYTDDESWSSYQDGLALLLEHIAARRGEGLPKAAAIAVNDMQGRKR